MLVPAQTDTELLTPALSITNDITAGTQLPGKSQWYSIAHTTVNKGKYLVFGYVRLLFTTETSGNSVQLYTGLYLNPTINATTKAISGGTEFAENNVYAIQYFQVPILGLINVTNDNSIIALGAWSNRADENAYAGSRNLQVIKIG